RSKRSGDSAVRAPRQIPRFVVSNSVHKPIGYAYGVIRVLSGTGLISVALIRAIEASGHERRNFFLLVNFPINELLDIWMIHIENHHLSSTSRRAATLDRSGCPITNAKK